MLNKQIPEVKGQVFIDGKECPVCLRPMIEGTFSWSISNFRRYESPGLPYEHRIYYEGGPHIDLWPTGVDFVRQISIGKRIYSNASDEMSISGSVQMLTGRAACDLPRERRQFKNLAMLVLRHQGSSEFKFSAVAGPCTDTNEGSKSLILEFWFEIPDLLIDLFIPDPSANLLFREIIDKYDKKMKIKKPQ